MSTTQRKCRSNEIEWMLKPTRVWVSEKCVKNVIDLAFVSQGRSLLESVLWLLKSFWLPHTNLSFARFSRRSHESWTATKRSAEGKHLRSACGFRNKFSLNLAEVSGGTKAKEEIQLPQNNQTETGSGRKVKLFFVMKFLFAYLPFSFVSDLVSNEEEWTTRVVGHSTFVETTWITIWMFMPNCWMIPKLHKTNRFHLARCLNWNSYRSSSSLNPRRRHS